MDPHIFYIAPEPWTDRFTRSPQPEHLDDRYNRGSVGRLETQGLLDEETRAFIHASDVIIYVTISDLSNNIFSNSAIDFFERAGGGVN